MPKTSLPPLPLTNENSQKEPREPAPFVVKPVFYSRPLLRDGAVRNSIYGMSGVKAEWLPRKLSELPAGKDSTQWIWGGYLAPGKITSFTGLWKSGKTTLITNLIKGAGRHGRELCRSSNQTY